MGITWSAANSIIGNILQLLQLIIVSSFLTTAEYGTMALALIIIYFAQFFTDMGIPNAMIFKQKFSSFQFNSLFWFNSFLGWLFFFIDFFSAPMLAAWYKQPDIINVLRVTGILFLFIAFDSHYRAVLKMKLQFKQLAIADIAGKLVSLIMAVLMAATGFGVYALVYSTLCAVAITGLLNVIQGWRFYALRFHFRLGEVKEFLHFGLYQTGENILNYLNYQVDSILVGKLIGIEALGIYSLAKNLAMKPLQIINPVVTQVGFPIMAGVNTDKDLVRKIYLQILRYLSAINFLLYPFLIAFAEPLIRIFFADKWLNAIPVLQVLSMYCMVRSVFNPSGALMASQGLVRYSFRYNLLLLFIIPAAIFLLSGYGLIWIAAGMTIIMIVLFIPVWRFLILPACQPTLKEYWQQVELPLLNAVLLTGLLLLYQLIPFNSDLLRLFSGIMVWLILCWLLTRYFNTNLYAEATSLLKEQLNQKAT